VRQQLLQLLLADREGQYNQLKKNKEKVKNRFLLIREFWKPNFQEEVKW
jgi:hypothetical protein